MADKGLKRIFASLKVFFISSETCLSINVCLYLLDRTLNCVLFNTTWGLGTDGNI